MASSFNVAEYGYST